MVPKKDLVLVTGGAGFIGSNIVDELLKRNYRVRIIDNFCTGRIENIKHIRDKIEIVKGDIRDKKLVAKTMKGVGFVFHEAALRSVPRSIDDPGSTNDVNITGTLNLLIAAKNAKVKRFIYASSSSAYGDTKELPKKESQNPQPIPSAIRFTSANRSRNCGYSSRALPRNMADSSSSADSMLS